MEYTASIPPESLACQLDTIPGVFVAEPIYPMGLATAPNDTIYNHPPYSNWHLEDIGLTHVWDAARKATPLWRIGIIDSGVMFSHPDLGGNWGPGFKIVAGYDFITQQPNPIDYSGCDYHGTEVTGLLAGLTNNVIGVASPAGGWYSDSPGESLLGPEIVQKVVGNYQGQTCRTVDSAMLDAIDASSDPMGDYRCRIISSSAFTHGGAYVEGVRGACAAAYKRGCALFFARGNQYAHPDSAAAVYPACFDKHWIVSVGASDRYDYRVSASQHGWHSMVGRGLDLVAPGIETTTTSYAAYPTGHPIYDSSFGGTSAATPVVAGCAALLQLNMPTQAVLAPEDYAGLLQAGCVDVTFDWDGGSGLEGWDDYTGAGLLNIEQSIDLMAPPSVFYQLETDPAGNHAHRIEQSIEMTFKDSPPMPDGVPVTVDVYEVTNYVLFPVEGWSAPLWGVGGRTGGLSRANPNYGEGFCEADYRDLYGAELRTYIYDVYYGDLYLGYFPKAPWDVVMGYSVVGVPLNPAGVNQSGFLGPLALRSLGSPGPSPRVVLDGHLGVGSEAVIYDASGRMMRRLRGVTTVGRTVFSWDGRDEAGKRCAPSVYLAQVKVDRRVLNAKMVLQ